ncbi:Aste57867_15638 [Aphanomyces stellatus]|uniref:Aste57867_15638 protein n=1 Tax=Aphanomyces stellatus TaxID=120398 RepID=A0A485L4W7_9STRA|nr:hypothetical protein As57867_015582 [Aphanomyces stellatus]VFT92435.1 Aste57867_15638 [Aphanomyces stellatus]
MARVVVSVANVQTTTASKSTFYLRLLGYLYVVFTLSVSLFYLTFLSKNATNDFWWQQFNTTGAQTYLIDFVNARLILGLSGPVDMFDPGVAILKDYSGATTVADTRRSAARRLILDNVPLNKAIQTIRANTLANNIYTLTEYCWVDLGRQFDMAHTAARQTRCNAHFSQNGAVYLETMFRNVATSELIQSQFATTLNQTIFQGVATFPNGGLWLQALLTHTWIPIDNEVTAWTAAGISRWKIQVYNLKELGLSSSITIVNAIGVSHSVTIMSIPSIQRSAAVWTTAFMYYGFWNDLWLSGPTILDCSLVRNVSNSIDAQGINWDFDMTGSFDPNSSHILRTNIGPFQSIDLYMVLPAATLIALSATFHQHVVTELRGSPTILHAYNQLPESLVDPIPRSWTGPNMQYYGGNPLCPFGKAQPFVQQAMDFYDTCQVPTPFSMHLRKDSALFAMAAMHLSLEPINEVCTLCVSQEAACIQTLHQVLAVSKALNAIINVTSSLQDTISLGIGLMQLALRDSIDNVLLFQPLVSALPQDPFSFFGWLMLDEWVAGQREVYTFDGDFRNLTLMSAREEIVPMTANPLELPRNACAYIQWLVLYISAILLFVGVIQNSFQVFSKSQLTWFNIFQWNRVVGSVWIGRPFMAVRGLVAVLILSTAPVTFQVDNGFTYFEYETRSVLHLAVLVGETLWLNYALVDLGLPLTQSHSRIYAPISSIVSFIIVFVLEYIFPVQFHMSLAHECDIVAFNKGLVCSSGTIEIGSYNHILLLVMIHLAVIVVTFVIVFFGVRLTSHVQKAHHHILIPGAAEGFFLDSSSDGLQLDAISSVMSGILPFKRFAFDLKTWSAIRVSNDHTNDMDVFERARFQSRPLCQNIIQVVPVSPSIKLHTKITWFQRAVNQISKRREKYFRLMGGLSFLYMASSVISSYAFSVVTHDLMANDFYWASFDSFTQAYLSNWLNMNLQVTESMAQVELDQIIYSSAESTHNASESVTFSSHLYANAVQDEANTLPNVIQAMRHMDACELPWIMTAYCYVDFGRTWSMAHSIGQEFRCNQDQKNGAVYLEAMLRNANWMELQKCFGEAFENAVFTFLRSSSQGQLWLNAIPTTPKSLMTEISYWNQRGITRYTTQWQNFKALGVSETYEIHNAFGHSYSMTLKLSTGIFQFAAQTSFKMYWGFANDLAAVTANATSPIAGLSLVTSAPNFAFSNTSLELVMEQNGTLASPWGVGTSLVRGLLGPYGSISIKRIEVPNALRQLHQNLTGEVMQLISSSYDVQVAFWHTYEDFTFTPRPQTWDPPVILHNGNLFCDIDLVDENLSPLVFFSFMGVCSNNFYEESYGTTLEMANAILAANLVAPTALLATDICNRETLDQPSCVRQINQTTDFFALQTGHLHMADPHDAKVIIRDQLQLQYFQYISADNDNSFQISLVNVFDPTEIEMELFSWIMLFDWVRGKREVIALQGDVSTLTTISTYVELISTPANTMEIPVNVSYCLRGVLGYVTGICFLIACITGIYIILVQGQVEATNMLSFNRVAGMVWVGRPLLLVRAVTGIVMLSTSGLVLTHAEAGFTLSFLSKTQPWYTTILSAGELSWFVYVINDTFSILTRQYTYKYSLKSSLIVWLTAALWGLYSPVQHTCAISRVCTVEILDRQVACHSGVVAIGSYSRFCGLIGLVFGCCIFCYVVERIRHPHLTANSVTGSSFLYASAKHQFFKSKWDYRGIHFMDKASAALNGLLTMEFRRTWYVLDVKTWRWFVFSPTETLGFEPYDLPRHLQDAMPLLE